MNDITSHRSAFESWHLPLLGSPRASFYRGQYPKAFLPHLLNRDNSCAERNHVNEKCVGWCQPVSANTSPGEDDCCYRSVCDFWFSKGGELSLYIETIYPQGKNDGHRQGRGPIRAPFGLIQSPPLCLCLLSCWAFHIFLCSCLIG